eukprot:TRINITY_DN666_c0_g1_i8.p1 TRINITY_DN666_c0_g1~~TRINITY_DN666_c0_g1_i8.p1  ORF type:complete len:218 (-),score=12.36 TRINITY_DN666_c0_g1_i8:63-716(-)
MFKVLLLCLAVLAIAEAKRIEVEHFNHSLIFDVFALDVAPIVTTRPQYKGLNTIYSFAGTPLLTETTDSWTCFEGRASDLTGHEIGHIEFCNWDELADPFPSSLWVAKLIVEDVGTLVVSFHMEGMVMEIAPDAAVTTSLWYQYGTLLPSTEGSFLSYLSKGEYKKWRGYCYADADIHVTLVAAAGAPVLYDFPRVFFDCSYRKPEHDKRVRTQKYY